MSADFAETKLNNNSKKMGKKQKKNFTGVLREWVEAVVIAFVLAMVIRWLVVQAFKIPSGSMKNTLLIGDHILVNKFIYYFTDVKRQDIIVFKYPKDESRDFIKRAIGLPGEKLYIKDRKVYINDQLLEEINYPRHDSSKIEPYPPRDNFGPLIIPKNKVFVMGDNRENSMDSRFWGFLDIDKIKGKAFIIYWSWDSENFRVRLERLGKILE